MMDMDIVGVGMMVALIILASAWAKRIMGVVPRGHHRITTVQQVASPDRQRALQVYESLCKEKLEVIKTALAMGYSQEELARLDARLERLIGREQLEKLARGEAPTPSADLHNVSLADESRLVRELKTAP